MAYSDDGNRRNNNAQLQTPTDLPDLFDKAAGLERQAETAVLGDAIAELAARIQSATATADPVGRYVPAGAPGKAWREGKPCSSYDMTETF